MNKSDFAAGPLTRGFWQQAASILQRIEELPFLQALVDGSLDPAIFVYYIAQDDCYLRGYGRAMSMLAAKAPTQAHTRFWAESVTGAIAAEEDMHQALLADARLVAAHQEQQGRVQISPTTLGYVSWLESTAALQSYRLGVAAILPCFWVYAHVGKKLLQEARDMGADHPYRTWIAMYDSPVFDGSTRRAVAILEECLQAADPAEQGAMWQAFERACTYEWHFWHASWIMQDWRLPAAPEDPDTTDTAAAALQERSLA